MLFIPQPVPSGMVYKLPRQPARAAADQPSLDARAALGEHDLPRRMGERRFDFATHNPIGACPRTGRPFRERPIMASTSALGRSLACMAPSCVATRAQPRRQRPIPPPVGSGISFSRGSPRYKRRRYLLGLTTPVSPHL